MTEILTILVILSILSGIVYLYRLCHRAWCRLSGQEDPSHKHGPLPVTRFVTYLRSLSERARSRLASGGAKKRSTADSTEME